MRNIELSLIERQLLCNQYKILDRLFPDHNYSEFVEILVQGFKYNYPKMFDVTFEEIDSDVCRETIDILNMFRNIENSIANLTPEEKDSLDLQKLQFSGFDGNNDPHYLYAKFMIDTQKKWDEHKDIALDSHNYTSLDRYRAMLKIAKKRNHLDLKDLQKMLDSK